MTLYLETSRHPLPYSSVNSTYIVPLKLVYIILYCIGIIIIYISGNGRDDIWLWSEKTEPFGRLRIFLNILIIMTNYENGNKKVVLKSLFKVTGPSSWQGPNWPQGLHAVNAVKSRYSSKFAWKSRVETISGNRCKSLDPTANISNNTQSIL